MKTTKSVERSPMQMTIVAFVLLFVAITATILFMYFKWFASEDLGAPAAVNVVGEKISYPDFLPIQKGCKVLEFKEVYVPDANLSIHLIMYSVKCGDSTEIHTFDKQTSVDKLISRNQYDESVDKDISMLTTFDTYNSAYLLHETNTGEKYNCGENESGKFINSKIVVTDLKAGRIMDAVFEKSDKYLSYDLVSLNEDQSFTYKINESEDPCNFSSQAEQIKNSDFVRYFSRYDNDSSHLVWPQDMAEEIVLDDGAILITSVLSNKKDKIVYFEAKDEEKHEDGSLSGFVGNIVLLDLLSKEKQIVKKIEWKPGCAVVQYIPVAWSLNDKKIILKEIFIGGGCSASWNDSYVLDVKTFQENVLSVTDSIYLNNYQQVIYLDTLEDLGGCGSDKVIQKDIESGKTEILADSDDEVYYNLLLLPSGDLQYDVYSVDSVDRTDYCSTNGQPETRTLKLE